MSDETCTPAATEGAEEHPQRIGVYICHCGGNISDFVDVDAVRDALKDEPGVVVSEAPMFACADGTQHDMIDDIHRDDLDGLVVASCSPKLHQVTFRNVSKRADINPYNYTQVNIREQGSWAHQHDRAGATEKVIGLVRAGVAKTRLSDPLEPLVVETVPRTLVVGAGITGLRAAVGLADVGIDVDLVEREENLGGWMATFGPTFPRDRAGRDEIAELVEQVHARPRITVHTRTELTGKSGSFGNYAVQLTTHGPDGDRVTEVTVGSVVVATGFDTYAPEPGEFGFGIDGVLTLPEFKRLVEESEGTLRHRGRDVHSVAYVYCVGSRQEAPGNEYCSKFCCTAAIHASLQVGAVDASVRQFHLHRDVRAYGKNELLYTKSREAGSVYLKYPDDGPPTVEELPDGRLGVTLIDVLTDGREITLPVDLVVLVTGMVPRRNEALVDLLKLPLGSDGFFNEIHPKLRPVETVVDGVLIAGCCQAPGSAAESVASGLSAVTQSAALLKKGYAELEPLVATVHPDACTGCGDCLEVCPYAAISLVHCDGAPVASVDAAACKGCGGCVPVCGDNALDLLGYTDEQMLAAIDGLVDLVKEPVG
ncbi:MAG: CoB--CoM heterodisulfide reductase iron-sulfur subunit A family protein [Candidatus Nanopelagicales bacterium]